MIHKVPTRKRMPPRVWKHDTAILWVIFQIRAICVYCLLHSKAYTVYTRYCTLCTIDDTHSVLCTLDTVYSVHYIPYMLYTVHSVQCSLYTVYPIYCKQWTQYIGQCAHYSLVARVGRVKGTWIKKKSRMLTMVQDDQEVAGTVWSTSRERFTDPILIDWAGPGTKVKWLK